MKEKMRILGTNEREMEIRNKSESDSESRKIDNKMNVW